MASAVGAARRRCFTESGPEGPRTQGHPDARAALSTASVAAVGGQVTRRPEAGSFHPGAQPRPRTGFAGLHRLLRKRCTPNPVSRSTPALRAMSSQTGFAGLHRLLRKRCTPNPVSRSTPALRAAWSGRRDSNPRPTAWKAVTLPLSYSRTPAKRRSGGGGWIRTIVGLCPTDLQSVAFDRSATPPATSSVEPAPGFEPRTYCLQGSCSTN